MAKYGMLIDSTLCIGCRGCSVACKQWNDLPGTKTRNTGTYQNPPALSAYTWTNIEYREVEASDRLVWAFLKRACMHCEHPACVSVCPVQALHKLETGPVVYEANRCIGCRYCMMACPFGIPKVDLNQVLPVISKCNFCADRVSNGLPPACAKTCPPGAIRFGERDQLVVEAEARIAKNPGKYVNHVYGKEEVGGTSILYLSAIPFDQLGLPDVGTESVPALSDAMAVVGTPTALVTVAAALMGAFWVSRRRVELASQQQTADLFSRRRAELADQQQTADQEKEAKQ